MNLVIVESPTKGNTIEKFLGDQYKVVSSFGHIRDLPKSELGLDIENDFKPKYIIPLKARKKIKPLKDEVKKASLVILATDEDREGEAIAWHLLEVLDLDKNKNYQRIAFHEITKEAIEESLKNPRKIDMNLVNAQQARRALDRLVGYKLSPFLWKKVVRGLSAGRVQSVAVRLVVEREREIENFVPQEYWTIFATLRESRNNEFEATLIKIDDEIIPKLGIKTKNEADKILKNLKDAEYQIQNIDKREVKRNPLPPFTTSTLQQEAWQRFRWPSKLTMRIAQDLYEKGLTTYHRTDSLNLSNLSLGAAKSFITTNYGENYYQFRTFKTKSKIAQEAHEAIRPTYPDNTPEKIAGKLESSQLKLYELIWRRFIACQMSKAIFYSTTVDIKAKNQRSKIKNQKYIFRATGQVLKFDGFLKVYPMKFKEAELPSLKLNESLHLVRLLSSQHFTQPPPRYNEATLIKALEENSIGRPSTYAPILSTIQERNYIEKDDQKRFRPTEIGFVVNDLLVKHFPEIVDIKFTARMEEELDEIAQGQKKWVEVLKEFYNPFEKRLRLKHQEVLKEDIVKKTKKKCPKCGANLLIRLGKFGKFYACSAFPKCKYTQSLEENNLGIKCPKCKTGKIVEKRTKRRKIFYGCSNWPKCDFALWDKPLKEKCPKCDSLLIVTKRGQVKCSSKECDYKS